MKKFLIVTIISSLIGSGACTEKKESQQDTLVKSALLVVAMASTIWQRVTPADVDPNFTYNGLTPSCSACPPSVDPGTGALTTFKPEYSFFVKRGTSNNLMIFFMGGGACWDITNCQYHHTYFAQLFETNTILGFLAMGIGGGGILDSGRANNPFKDWTIVWVPYCTGDLGIGANDYTYPEHAPVSYPGGSTIRHRGLVNVKLVMKWLQNNITTAPDKLFVTGISAGSYTAAMSYPYIRDIFPWPATKGYMLGDSGVGVSGVRADSKKFFAIVGDPGAPWGGLLGITLPPTFFKTISNYADYKEAFTELTNDFPNDRFAQFTMKWDKIQTWFYSIQTGGNINLPDTWGIETSANPDTATMNAWETGMKTQIAVGTPNYTYYIGSGSSHTILTRNTFYTEASAGLSLAEWVNNLVNGTTIPAAVECSSCDTW